MKWHIPYLLVAFLALQTARAGDGGIDQVAVIAHSVSTSMMARQILFRAGWRAVAPRKAQFVLVICRSELLNPLDAAYKSFKDLDRAAALQLNIAGSLYHLYVYRINEDLTLTAWTHRSCRALD